MGSLLAALSHTASQCSLALFSQHATRLVSGRDRPAFASVQMLCFVALANQCVQIFHAFHSALLMRMIAPGTSSASTPSPGNTLLATQRTMRASSSQTPASV